MISSIRGKIVKKLPTYLIVEVDGIGYGVHIPVSTYTNLGNVGEVVKLLTHLYVREDCLALYGFSTEGERELFSLLISVSGIGPRVAIAVLSGVPVDELKRAIGEGDISVLTAISGVGKKIAQRLVVELKDKVDVAFLERRGKRAGVLSAEESSVRDAIAALVSLGCKVPAAQKAVREACSRLPKDAKVEELVKEAMKHL